MSLTTVEYQDSFCQAVNAIVDQRLRGVQYDITKKCSIEDASQAASGKYYVKSEKASFYAYSENTKYRKGENVYVLIPQNDNTQRKTIIGLVPDNDDGIIKTASPLDNMAIFKTYTPSFSSKGILVNNPDVYEKQIAVIDSLSRDELSAFTYFAIEAGVNTLIPYNFITSGEYGIKVYFYTQNQQEPIQTCIFSSQDFLGNAYNLNSFFTQQRLFDLNLGDLYNFNDTLITIKIALYQNNDFKYFDNVKELYVPYVDELASAEFGSTVLLKDNVVIGDIKLHFGRPVTDFPEDTMSIVEIYPQKPYYDYEKNEANYNFGVKWFFKNSTYNDAGEVDEVFYRMFTSVQEVGQYFNQDLNDQYRVLKWYEYKEGAADAGAGVDWKETSGFNFNYGTTIKCSAEGSYQVSKLTIKCRLEDSFSSIDSNKIYYSNILECQSADDSFSFQRIEESTAANTEQVIEANGINFSYGENYLYEGEQMDDGSYSDDSMFTETREISFGKAKIRLCANGDIQFLNKDDKWISLNDLTIKSST